MKANLSSRPASQQKLCYVGEGRETIKGLGNETYDK